MGTFVSVWNLEKNKPENRGRTVVFDKKRQILIDGKVVDFWYLMITVYSRETCFT